MQKANFAGGLLSVDAVFDLRSADFADPAVRAALRAARDRVAALPRTLPPVGSFLDGGGPCPHRGNRTACSDADVRAWFAAPANAHWRSSLVFGETGRLATCRFTAQMAEPVRAALAPLLSSRPAQASALFPFMSSAHAMAAVAVLKSSPRPRREGRGSELRHEHDDPRSPRSSRRWR